MAPPAGIRPARWNNTVARIVERTGRSTAQVDAWLNRVWREMKTEDETGGDGPARDHLRQFLEERQVAPTLPVAMQMFLMQTPPTRGGRGGEGG
jgi:hypothetical protein